MKKAVLYAGQGSQKVGMGADFYDRYSEFKNLFDNNDLDFDLKRMCFEDPDNLLRITKYTQPCITAFTVGISQILKNNGFKADYCAGLSLGEYAALEMADVFKAQDVIDITAKRGQAMDDASKGIECQMVAVLGLEEKVLGELTNTYSELGCVSITNYNCPGQIVIGGEKAAVNACADEAMKRGASGVVQLEVSGPFHTRMMQPARNELDATLNSVELGQMNTSVVFNCLGTEKDLNMNIRDLLLRQLVEPVRMEQTIRYLFANGVREFIEIGPGHTLSGFVKRTARSEHLTDVKITSIGTVEEMEAFLNKGVA